MRFIPAITKISNVPPAIVDDNDYEMLMRYQWNVKYAKGYYYYTRINKRRVGMPHIILSTEPSIIIDHKNRVTHDNQRINIRISNHSLNSANRRKVRGKSRFKGVCFDNNYKSHPWRATLRYHDKSIYIGSYVTEEIAALAYNREARIRWGEHAFINEL